MLIKHGYLNIKRDKLKSLFIILISCILFIVTYEYKESITNDINKLDEIYETLPVTGELYSNYDKYSKIPFSLVEEIQDTGFIKDVTLDTIYYAYMIYPNITLSFAENHKGEFVNDLNQQDKILGINDINNSSYIPNNTIFEYMEDNKTNDFNGDLPDILVSKELMDQFNLSFGDTIILLGEYIPNMKSSNHITEIDLGIEFTICGNFTFPNAARDQYEFKNINYIAPIKSLLHSIDSYFINEKISGEHYLNYNNEINTGAYILNASFTLGNTKALSNFKTYLQEKDFVSQTTNATKYSFNINDYILEFSTKPIIKSITFKENIFIVILILVCIINLIISFITTHKRMYYMALMRILGFSKGKTFLQIFFEYFFLGTLGVVAAYIILLLKYKVGNLNFNLKFMFLYIGCNHIGSILGILLILRMSTMKILLSKE